MSTVKSKKLQVGTDASASNNFTIYQPATPDGTLRIGVGNADSPTEVGRFDSNGYVATKAPAFAAYLSSNQTISTTTWTKVQINTELFDTTSNFDTSTYRFTPTVAGYYQVNIQVYGTSSVGRAIFGALYKNGNRDSEFGFYGPSTPTVLDDASATNSILVYLNGTTDYIEAYAYIDAGTPVVFGTQALSHFSAFLAIAV